MLVQTYRREVPEAGAFIERTLLRDSMLSVAVVTAEGIAVDRGVLDGALKFPRYFRRPQISVMLEGSGYFDCEARIVGFARGDLVQTDQCTHAGEGYGGRTTHALIVDWEGRADGEGTSVGHLGEADFSALRSHVRKLGDLPPEVWVDDLVRRLRSLGLPVAADRDEAPSPRPPESLVQLYSALGGALSSLHAHPSLADLTSLLGGSERQLNRRLAELHREYGHPFNSWRDFVHEMRIDWASQLLSIPTLSLERVATLAGYRSVAALHHAFSNRGAATPRTIARRLSERWG